MRQATGRGRTFYGRSPNESGQHPPELRTGPTRARRRLGGFWRSLWEAGATPCEMHLGLTAPANLLRASRTRAGMATAGAAGPALRRPHRYVDINSYEHRPVHTLDAIQPAWTHFRQPVVPDGQPRRSHQPGPSPAAGGLRASIGRIDLLNEDEIGKPLAGRCLWHPGGAAVPVQVTVNIKSPKNVCSGPPRGGPLLCRPLTCIFVRRQGLEPRTR